MALLCLHGTASACGCLALSCRRAWFSAERRGQPPSGGGTPCPALTSLSGTLLRAELAPGVPRASCCACTSSGCGRGRDRDGSPGQGPGSTRPDLRLRAAPATGSSQSVAVLTFLCSLLDGSLPKHVICKVSVLCCCAPLLGLTPSKPPAWGCWGAGEGIRKPAELAGPSVFGVAELELCSQTCVALALGAGGDSAGLRLTLVFLPPGAVYHHAPGGLYPGGEPIRKRPMLQRLLDAIQAPPSPCSWFL